MGALLLQLSVTLLLAHLLGDFVFQSDWLVKKKEKIVWLFIHSLIHGILVYLFLSSWDNWIPPVVITLSHFLIDLIKKLTKKDSLIAFIVDQLMHLLVIVLLIAFYLIPNAILPPWVTHLPPYTITVIIHLIAVILLLPVGGILIGYFVYPFQEQLHKRFRPGSLIPIEGLKDGGKFIGFLERALIFVFILSGEFAGVGFLVAAKSIFRFGE